MHSEYLFIVNRGDVFEYGLFKCRFIDNIVESCDPYGCSRTIVYSDHVYIVPTYPIHRPRRISDCVYIEFDESLSIGGSGFFWIKSPFDLAVTVDDLVLGYYTPLKVKYTLIGDPLEGDICRYYKSRIYSSDDEVDLNPGEAIIGVNIEGRGVVKGLAFYVYAVNLYQAGGRIYYDTLDTIVDYNRVEVKPGDKPPVPGLTKFKTISEQARLFLMPPKTFVLTM